MESRALFARFSVTVLAALVVAVAAFATLTVDEQGRYYLYVLDSNGNPTDGTDAVEVRPHSDTSPGAAIDATFVGGFSSTWYWSVEWFDDQEVYKLYVNGVAQTDSLQMDNAVQNSIAADAIQADAVTPAKLDSDGTFQLDPASATAALRVDFDTSDPAGGVAYEVDFGGQAQTGLKLGTLTITNQEGISGTAAGSGSPTVIDIANTATGSSARGLAVSTSAEGAGASGIEVTNNGDGTGVLVTNIGDTDSPIGLEIQNTSGAILPYGLWAESTSGGRTAWMKGNELVLGLEADAVDDTLLLLKGGSMFWQDNGHTWAMGEHAIDVDWNSLGDWLYANLDNPSASGTGTAFRTEAAAGTEYTVGYYGEVRPGTNGSNAARFVVKSGSGGISTALNVQNFAGLDGKGATFASGGTHWAEEYGAAAAFISDLATGIQTVRIESQTAPNLYGLVVEKDGTSATSRNAAIYSIVTDDISGNVSGLRVGLGGTTSLNSGVRVEVGTSFAGEVFQAFHNSSSSGKVLDIDFPNTPFQTYTGPGMIHLVEADTDFEMQGPLILFDAKTAHGIGEGIVELRGTGGGPMLLIESTGSSAIDVQDGFVWLDAADQVTLPASTTAPGAPQQGAVYFDDDDLTWNFRDGGTWYSVGMTSSAQAKFGGSYADTLVVPFGSGGGGWAGSNCTAWGGASIFVNLRRVAFGGTDFCTCTEALVPSLADRTTVEIHAFISSSAAGGNDQVITSKVSTFQAGEGWDSWTYSDMDTLTMVANAQDPVEAVWTHDITSEDSGDRVLVIGLQRNSGDAGDTDTSAYTYIHPGGYALIY